MKNAIILRKDSLTRGAVLAALAFAAGCTAPLGAEAVRQDGAGEPLASSGVFEHCISDAVSLDGEWEMSYRESAWESEEYPVFTGVRVTNAIPGYWEDMKAEFRAAGMRDDFRINPDYVRQTLPVQGLALDMTLENIYGCFLYRKKIVLERTGRAVLHFEGVRNQVYVWVNGSFAASRQGYSTPFELDIPDGLLREGENEIVLAVSNNLNAGHAGAAVTGMTTRGLYAATGGVNGHLELRFPRTALSDVFVTTASDLKSFTVHVGEWGAENGERFAWEILDGAKIAANGEAAGDFTMPTEGFDFWSPENPKRYELVLKTAGGEYRQKFGLRRLTADGEKLRLNGKFVYLRGTTEHCYFPESVHLPRDIGYYRMMTAKRKELGFNFVRFHTYVPPVEYLEAMDELGMLVQIESPNFVPLGEYRAIVAFARRHPCVVIYCTGNETRIDRIAEDYLRQVAAIVHSETDSLFSPMSAMRGVEYRLMPGLDTISETPFPHNPEKMAHLAEFCDLFNSFQLDAMSYDSLNGASAEEVDRWGDAYCGKPRLSHEICIDGSYADLSLEKLYPSGSPIVGVGLFSERRKLIEGKGLLDRARQYAVNSSEWMRRIRKFCFEKMRSSRRTAGYDFLGDINSQQMFFGFSDGMMDEFWRLKPGETVENVLRYNSAAVLLSDLGRDFNVAAGTKKRVAFSVSNYAGDAVDATLRVELVACRHGEDSRAEAHRRGECVWEMEKKVGGVKNGDIAALGDFEVPFPAADAPRKYLLRASFAGGAVKAENEWEMYAFPRAAAAPALSRDLRIVSDISRDDLLAAMAHGERILLLGPGPFKSLKTSFRIGLAGRSDGHYATVIKPGHSALADFPHDGFCGWQFAGLMEGGDAVQLEAGVPFDPIIDVASSDKFVIRQAALFEYRLGAGRLMVCSFAFREDDPAAVWLKDRLVRYASSDRFEPVAALSLDQLRAVLDAPLLTGRENAGGKARNPNDPSALVRADADAQP